MEYIYLKEMPGYCHELVSQNKDGSYTIVINNCLCREQQLEAYYHAMRHIEGEHFDIAGNVQELETNAHKEEQDEHGKD